MDLQEGLLQICGERAPFLDQSLPFLFGQYLRSCFPAIQSVYDVLHPPSQFTAFCGKNPDLCVLLLCNHPEMLDTADRACM